MEDYNDHTSEVLDAVRVLGLRCEELNYESSKSIKTEILAKFTENHNSYIFPLWEHITDSYAFQCQYGWEKLKNILEGKSSILFFEFADTAKMLFFEDGRVLSDVLENCYRFVFYITDYESSFLIAYNDHDFLIGSGSAKHWIKEADDC